jgi:hypothetical protein
VSRRTATALFIACLLLPASHAQATTSFAYSWQEGRVTVRWREGGRGGREAAVRSLVGHWKRLAVTAWSGTAVPLTIDVTLYGPSMGSGVPSVRLAAGGREVTVAATRPGGEATLLTDARFLAALRQLQRPAGRSPDGARAGGRVLADDGRPRLSPDGQWVAFRTWRSGQPEVWLASADGRRTWRCALPGSPASSSPLVAAPLIDAGPRWSPDGRRVIWLQGGSLCEASVGTWTGRVLTGRQWAAVAVAPSPLPGLTVVEGEDGQMLLLDLKRLRAAPFHALVPDLMSQGSYHWSPTGRRLLFRAQSGVSTANLRQRSSFLDWLQGVARAARGQPAPTAPPGEGGPGAIEEYGERLAVLDLDAGRLLTVPLGAASASMAELTGVVWTPDERHVYLSTRGIDGRSGLWRMSLQPPFLSPIPSDRAAAISAGRLLALAWRRETGAPGQLLVADDKRLMTWAPDGNRQEEAGPVAWLCLTPGPDGGYRGVDDAEEEETEDEPAPWVMWGQSSRLSAPGSRLEPAVAWSREPGAGSFVPLRADGTLAVALKSALEEGRAGGPRPIVDLDLDAREDSAVLCISPGGGVCELRTVAQDGQMRTLSRALDEAAPSVIAMQGASVTLLGTRSGLAALTRDLRGERGGRAFWAFGFLAGAGGLLFVVRRRGRRKGSSGEPLNR